MNAMTDPTPVPVLVNEIMWIALNLARSQSVFDACRRSTMPSEGIQRRHVTRDDAESALRERVEVLAARVPTAAEVAALGRVMGDYIQLIPTEIKALRLAEIESCAALIERSSQP